MKTAMFCVLIAGAMSLVGMKYGDDKDAQPPATGFRAEYLGQIDFVKGRIIDLEQAVPQEKFTWRPEEGVRSVGEVYAHIAYGNYLLLKFVGFDPPAGVPFTPDPKKWESMTMDKDELASTLRTSFDHVRSCVIKVSDEDLDKKVLFFGRETTARDALLAELGHLHEHLGQSIAYARMNGVVPPWTAAEQAKEREELEKRK